MQFYNHNHTTHGGKSSEYLRHVRVSSSPGQGQGHRSQKSCLFIVFEDDLPSIEMQSIVDFFSYELLLD